MRPINVHLSGADEALSRCRMELQAALDHGDELAAAMKAYTEL